MADSWLADTRNSYDADADGYAEKVQGLLETNPYLSASVALFANLVHDAGGGAVADIGCGPGYVTRPSYRRPPAKVARWLREAGFTIEAELVMRPDEEVPGAILLARSPA
jgi:hypothetical protein